MNCTDYLLWVSTMFMDGFYKNFPTLVVHSPKYMLEGVVALMHLQKHTNKEEDINQYMTWQTCRDVSYNKEITCPIYEIVTYCWVQQYHDRVPKQF